MNPEKQGTVNGYWMPTLLFDRALGFDRGRLLQRFQEHGIDGRVFFYPLSSLPMFQPKRENEVSYDIFERAINLPSYHDLTDDDLLRVVEEVKAVLDDGINHMQE